MRFYELAAKIGIEKKDIAVLLECANEKGFDVKNSLATVGNDVIKWAEAHSDDLAARVVEAKEKKKPVKKRVSVRKSAPKKKLADSESSASVEDSQEQSQAEKKVEEKKPEKVVEPVRVQAPVAREVKPAEKSEHKPAPKFAPKKPVREESAPVAKNIAPTKEDLAKYSKPNKSFKAKSAPAKKKASGTELKLSPNKAPAPSAGSQVVLDNSSREDHHTGAKHKRADFKGHMSTPELPAIFSSMDSEYTRSIRSSGGRSRGRGHGGQGGGRKGGKNKRTSQQPQQRDPNSVAILSRAMTLRDLSVALGVKLNSIMGYFMKSGQMFGVNDILGEDEIVVVAEEFEIPYEWKKEETLEQQLEKELEEQEAASSQDKKVTRPPIVTFMGHVDHGKTSLLDKIRETRVAEGESGGITQHIGAYTVEKNGHEVTFLDTPGHEAFTQMRARGANLTDVTVLVVAADDGVMPQTKEAYFHAKNAGVPVVVAINKCDMASANPDKVRQELSTQLELLPEEWGGNTGMIEVSAYTGQGIDDLLERILLESEMLELSANPERNAVGFVIESEMTENRGVVATMLVLDGTLRRGDILLTSNGYGKVKLMYDWNGNTTEEGGPSTAVSVVGLNAVPEVGDKVFVVEDMVKARKLSEERENENRNKALTRQKRQHVTLENLTAYLAEGEKRELNVIIKADVTGSLEVLQNTLEDLSTDEVGINIIYSGVGGVTQADVILADASDALIVGFHVVADSVAKLQATSHNVQIKVYHIIYRLIEDMRAALEGMLPPEEKEVIRGEVEIREVFRSSKLGNIAGCYVTDGAINRSCRVRLIRENVVIYDGKIDGLRRFKDEVKEVRSGFECGLRIVGYDDIKVGDRLEAYEIEEIARTLD